MQKKLLSGLFWVLLLNLIVKPFWIFAIEVGVQNTVGTSEYGLYFAVFNLAYILNILLDLGLTNYNTRHIAQNPQLVSKHMAHILPVKLLLLGVYLVVTFALAAAQGSDSRSLHLLVWLCVNQFLNSLLIYLRSNFEGLLMFRADSVLSVLDRVLMIVICGGLMWLSGRRELPFTIEWFVMAQTASYGVSVLVAAALLAKRTGPLRLRWNGAMAWAMVRRSLPYALLVLLMASYNRIDSVLLRQLLPDGDYQSGLYAAAFRLLDAFTMIAYLLSVPLLPVFSRMTRSVERGSGRAELADTAWMMFSLLMAYSVVVAAACSGAGEQVMGLLYHGAGGDTQVMVFRRLLYGLIPIGTTYVFGTLLTAGGKLRQLNLLAAVSLVLNVGINLWLIPYYGALGSVWASLSAQTFMAVSQLLLAVRLYGLRPAGPYVVRMLAFAAIAVGASLLLRGVPLAASWWPWLLYGLVMAALAFAMRLIDCKKILFIMRSGQEADGEAIASDAAPNNTLSI